MNIKRELSIIVPVYNVEKYLKECLDSINEIKNIDYELLIINDGSTDKSQNIIEEFCKKNDRVKYYKKKNGGISSARNYGLQKACGKWILFVDSDDLIITENFEKVFLRNISLDKDTIFCESIAFLDGEDRKEKIKKNLLRKTEKFNYIFKKVIRKSPSVWKNIYNKNFLETENIYFDEELSIGEDLFFNYKILSKTKKIIYINEDIYLYRTNRKGSIMSDLKNKQKIHYDIAKKMYNEIKDKKVSKEVKKYPIHLYNTWLKDIKERDLEIEKKLWKIEGIYFYKLKIALDIIFQTYILRKYKS